MLKAPVAREAEFDSCNSISSAEILDSFAKRRVVVVGDVMLDDYLWGNVRRICPEAPVPVVESCKRSSNPGGAANAAANIAALGGSVRLLSVTGVDEAGQLLRNALMKLNIETSGLLVSEDRPTTSKTRVIAHNQQILRIDTEETHFIPRSLGNRLAAQVEQDLVEADVLLLCDYAKGVLSAEITARLIAAARRANLPVVVDPKGKEFQHYRGATVIKPNIRELECFFRHAIKNWDELDIAATKLVTELDGGSVLVTRGPDGMTLFQPGMAPWHQPVAGVRPVVDVTGAGDTVVSLLTLMLASRVPLTEIIPIANVAANIAVSRLGTTVVPLEELREALRGKLPAPFERRREPKSIGDAHSPKLVEELQLW